MDANDVVNVDCLQTLASQILCDIDTTNFVVAEPRIIDITNLGEEVHEQQCSSLPDDYSSSASLTEGTVSPSDLEDLYQHVFSHQILEEHANAKRYCHVCGNEAGRHNYYGGQACNSCRAFFRRSVQTGNYERFECSSGRNCIIDSKSWRSCQWCRFNKCLTCGMRISWVLNDTERRIRIRHSGHKSDSHDHSHLPSALVRTPSDEFTLEDEIQIRGLNSAAMDYINDELLQFFAQNLGCYEEFLNAIYHGTSVSAARERRVDAFIMSCGRKFYARMGDFMQLKESDQLKLMAHNFPIALAYIKSVHIDIPGIPDKFGSLFLSSLKKTAHRDEYVRLLEDKFNEVSLFDSLKRRDRFLYDQAFPDNWCSDSATRSRHRELTFKVRDWPLSECTGVKSMDEIQSSILILMIILSPDFIDLDNRHAVETVQTKYAAMLSRYLKKRYSTGSAGKFCTAMTVKSICRELTEMNQQRYEAT